MHELVYFDGEIQSLASAQIPAVSAAALYGAGVFTTVAVYNRKPFLWRLHAARLRDNAAKIGLDASAVNFESIENNLLELVAANKIERGRARITLFDAGASDVWRFETNQKIAILIVADNAPAAPKNFLNLTVSPFPINSASALAGVKSCNYAENLLALKHAKANNFDEAVRVNERSEVVSAIMANVFWTRNETVFTPALRTGALAGTTREFVIAAARENDFEVQETTASLEKLRTADEMFLTSAGLGVSAVKSLDGKEFRNVLAANLSKHLVEIASWS